MTWVYLGDLPRPHPSRNRPLAEIGAEQAWRHAKEPRWIKVTSAWKIAKSTFNELAHDVWVEHHNWRVHENG